MNLRYYIILLLVTTVILANHVVVTMGESSAVSEACLNDTLFYAYGVSTCPHCKRLHGFFDLEFKENYVFCYFDENATCSENFKSLVSKISKMPGYDRVSRLLAYVPLTVVTKNNTETVAIVVGEVTDRVFWLNLACREPDGKILFYSGTKLVAVLGEQQNIGGMPSELVIGITALSLLVIVIGGYYLYTHLFLKESTKRKPLVKGRVRERGKK